MHCNLQRWVIFKSFFAEIYAMWTRKDVSLPKRMSDFVLEVLE